MTVTSTALPADLVARLEAVPRDQPMVLDISATVAREGGPAAEVRLRLVSGDPLEGERDGPDRFVATHPAGADGTGEVIAYLSYGQAELDAEAGGGWSALLARAATTVAHAVAAADGKPIGAAHGPDPLADLTLVDGADEDHRPDGPGAVTGWAVGDWQPFTIGVLVDLAEAEDGPVGFPHEPVVPSPAPRPRPGCAGCAGTPLHPPHTPIDVVVDLCRDHGRQHDHWVGEHLPEMREGEIHTLYSLILSEQTIFVSGVGAGLRAVDAGLMTAADLLRRARTWFDTSGGLSPVYADDDDLAAVLGEAAAEVHRSEGLEPALAALDDLRFVVPETCWLCDLDALVWLPPDDPRGAALLDHLVEAHEDEPGALHGAGEMHERLGDLDTAGELFRRSYVRSLAAGDLMTAELGMAGMGRVGVEPPAPTRAVGRNDPCPCGSGRKFKRCCGR